MIGSGRFPRYRAFRENRARKALGVCKPWDYKDYKAVRRK
jgi:hypothetical protein